MRYGHGGIGNNFNFLLAFVEESRVAFKKNILGTGEATLSCHLVKAKIIGRNVGMHCVEEPVGQCCSDLPLKWEASKTAKVQRGKNQYLASPAVQLSVFSQNHTEFLYEHARVYFTML